MADDRRPDALLPAPRNFSLSLDERVRGLEGPPPWSRRLRDIEDLEARLGRAFAALGDRPPPRHLVEALDRLNDLIDRHNRYYPIEASLRIDLRTGGLLDRDGRPFRPRKHWTSGALRHRGA